MPASRLPTGTNVSGLHDLQQHVGTDADLGGIDLVLKQLIQLGEPPLLAGAVLRPGINGFELPQPSCRLACLSHS